MLNKFSQLGLSPDLIKAVEFLGFETPTPIQEEAIPILVEGRQDFIGLAQTGTGKTAAFGLPLLDNVEVDNRHIQGLILAPTRELGKQIAQQLEIFAKFIHGLRVQVVYGGSSIYNQIQALKNTPQILIATPGRLIDLIDRKKVFLDQVKVVVLDEADEMLSMGFKDELNNILSHTPENKNTWLFSATMAKEIRNIIKNYMSDPVEVKVNTKNQVNLDIEHQYVLLRNKDKMETIKRILDVNPDMRGIIFCRTRRETQSLAEELMAAGYKADALHGDLSQAQRDRVMGRFKKHALQVLVGTDVAARGIDVDNLTHVIHHSLPDELAYYTHRSGRTGRAGNKGVSVAFLPPSGMRKIKQLERSLKIRFSKLHIPSNKEVMVFRLHNWAENIVQSDFKNSKIGQDTIDNVLGVFEDLSKEQLVVRLIAHELKNLGLSSSDKDLNLKEKSDFSDRRRGRRDRGDRRGRDRRDKKDWREKDRDRNRSDRKKKGLRNDRKDNERRTNRFSERRKSNPGAKRFFINMGTMDKFDSSKLVRFISDHAKIDKKAISNITLRQKHAYFDVSSEESKRISHAFKNLEVQGRAIRVNRDN
ncbi:MAG TPA: DEAD/DEAH box helicase [Saprospiraceae bacterium]|nr:DEAD/DEAH box helicase [Saprospiraceae bacterium]